MERAFAVKKVYLSGQITGMPLEVAKAIFAEAEARLRAQGHDVINPLTINTPDPKKHWVDYMMVDIEAMVREARAIYLLPNWGESRGARIEYAIAKELGLEVMFQNCNAAISKAEIQNCNQ